jgi:hypothetical protein
MYLLSRRVAAPEGDGSQKLCPGALVSPCCGMPHPLPQAVHLHKLPGLRVKKFMDSLSCSSPSRRCWFLIRPKHFLADPETVVQSLRMHPRVHRVDWSPQSPTAAVHLQGATVDCFRSHRVLLTGLLERLMPQQVTGGLVLSLALYDFHPDSVLFPSLARSILHRLPIYLHIQDGHNGPLLAAIHRPNPHTDTVFQVRPDCPAGEWAALPLEILATGTPITPTRFYAALADPWQFADSLRLSNG